MIVCIFKAYMVKFDCSLYIGKRLCSLFIPDIGSHIHNLLKTLNPGHSSLELLRKLDNPADGCQKSGHVHGIGDQISRSDLSVNHEKASGHDHQHIHQAVKGTGGNLKGRHIPVGMLFDLHKLPVAFSEFFNLHRLICKGTNHPVS